MSQKRSLSFFKRRKPEPKSKVQSISSDLAMKIIEKELDLEKFWDPKIIHELMSLYTQAIEYYEQNNNPKFYDFQDRMHKMLIKPQVISALQRLNCPKTTEESPVSLYFEKPEIIVDTIEVVSEESPTKEKVVQEIPKEVKKVGRTANFLSNLDARKEQAERTRKFLSKELTKNLMKNKPHKNLNIIIDRHSSSTRETAHKAVADFKSQDCALQRRLASRKKSVLARSMTFTSSSYTSNDTSQVFGCDLSDMNEELNSSTKSSFFTIDEQSLETCERFEKKLEEIMEKNFSERSIKIAEIKYRYESQISEIFGMGDMMDMLIKQMRINMQEEIDSIIKDYDNKRKDEIRKLKEGISN
ncbi:hypothetical protein SteCoe_21524 [Stentor coeruleus]|uniref:Uncharacterized protein n=1 Tax=Stentor coeruleus TaxID=5963 RepID=A0A1R2BPG9_9CILI|nr:hypothetical protein SteCoe_21524 [Stentor coeruleus]